MVAIFISYGRACTYLNPFSKLTNVRSRAAISRCLRALVQSSTFYQELGIWLLIVLVRGDYGLV